MMCKMNAFRCLLAVVALGGGCSRVVVDDNVNCETDAQGNTNCTAGGRVGVSFQSDIGEFLTAGGADALELDVSRSNVGIPADHEVTVTIRDEFDSAVAQQTFAADSANDRISFENPYAVDALLSNNASNTAVLEVGIAPFQVNEVQGENAFIMEVEFNGQVLGSHGELWTNGDCPQNVSEGGQWQTC